MRTVRVVLKLDSDSYHYWQQLLTSDERFYREICNWMLLQFDHRTWRRCKCNEVYKFVNNHNDEYWSSTSVDLPDEIWDISVNLIDKMIDCPLLLIQWSIRLLPHINTASRLYDTMAILSTLGGAYSALGDASDQFSAKAEEISMKQLFVAKMLGDPTLTSKCKLYLALSLMQRGYLSEAKRIIRSQYKFAMYSPACSDTKLIDICQACWSKLLYYKDIAITVGD